jgi:ATP-binding cassette subfamily B protein
VLDEATSGLDSATEQSLENATRELTRGRTTLLIAHRLGTVCRADQILVMDRGRISERGTHETLLAENGLYAQLWRAYCGTQDWHISKGGAV